MTDIYADGTYLRENETWHEEDSLWKAQQIRKIIDRNALSPSSICEVGCGAGEILIQLSELLGDDKEYCGFEISPQAYRICEPKTRSNISFFLRDFFEDPVESFDIVMAIDVFEHVEDYFGFLRRLKPKGEHKIFHIPLDLSVQSVLRAAPILKHRQSVGHIHYFTKETALATIEDTGYDIVDYFYTSSLDLPNRSWKSKLLKIPRALAFFVNEDLAVRILGGYSLLVLAR